MIRDLIYFETRVEERDKILIPLLFSGNSVIEHFTCDMGQLISNLFSCLDRYEHISPTLITRHLEMRFSPTHQLSTQQNGNIFWPKERLKDSKCTHESITSCHGSQLEIGRPRIQSLLFNFMFNPTAYILHNYWIRNQHS